MAWRLSVNRWNPFRLRFRAADYCTPRVTTDESLKVAPFSSMTAVSSNDALSLAIFLPISRWMADRFDTRRVSRRASGPGALLAAVGTSPFRVGSPAWLIHGIHLSGGCPGATPLTVVARVT